MEAITYLSKTLKEGTTLTLEGSMMTVGTKLRKMWLQSVRTLVLLKATSSSSMASKRSRSPSF